LIWLGFKFLRSPGALGDPARIPAPRMGFFWQGFLVLMSNPKALLLFGAFIPQFVDPKGDYIRQVLILGVTAMAVAGIFDSGYAGYLRDASARCCRQRARGWSCG
jgi:Putative threonine efflux protein